MIGGACMNGAFGQKAYTLDECIQAALTNNVRMKNATNELEMAKQDKKKAFTNYFPSVSAAGTGFMADKGLMQMSLGPDMNMSMLKNGIALSDAADDVILRAFLPAVVHRRTDCERKPAGQGGSRSETPATELVRQ